MTPDVVDVPIVRRRHTEQFADGDGVSNYPMPRSRASFDVEASPWGDSLINVRFYKRMRIFVPENRKTESIRAGLKTGQIYFGDPKERCGCLIWNLNKGGALIEVASDGPFPQKLRLISAALEVDKLCYVISHEGRKISLKFAP